MDDEEQLEHSKTQSFKKEQKSALNTVTLLWNTK